MPSFLLLCLFLIGCTTVCGDSKYYEPIQLVAPTEDHSQLVIVEEGVRKLMDLIGDDKVAVLSVVGPYHSGKSFLLNSLLLDEDGRSNFKIGKKTDPETLGLWFLPTKLKAADGATVLLLDTEGFYGSNISEAYDAKIFAVSALLSSHLIYNSIKLIDQAAVEYLLILARRTQLFQLSNTLHIMVKADNDEDEEMSRILHLANDMPRFSWVVEDFFQDLDGKSPTQWLNEFMENVRDSETNRTELAGLKQIFSKGIDCHTLFLPATSKDHLQDLSTVPEHMLTTEFKKEIKDLKTKIFSTLTSRGSVAKGDNKGLSGANLVSLSRFLVESANMNRFPKLPSLWQGWLKQLVDEAKNETGIYFTNDLRTRIGLSKDGKGLLHNSVENLQPAASIRTAIAESGKKAENYFIEMLFALKHVYQPNLPSLKPILEKAQTQCLQEYQQQVKKCVGDAIRVFELKASQNTIGIDGYPMKPQDLTNVIQTNLGPVFTVAKSTIARFHLDKVFDGTLFETQLTHKRTEFENEIRAKNEKAMMDALSNLRTDASKAFSDVIRHVLKTDEIFTKSRLDEIHVKAKKAASAAQQSAMGDKKWILELESGKKVLQENEEALRGDWNGALEANEARLRKMIRQTEENAFATYSTREKGIKIPDEEDTVTAEAKQLSQSAMDQFISKMKDFSDHPNYLEHLKILRLKLSESKDELTKKNVRLVLISTETAKTCTVKKFRATDCFLCKFVPQVFDSTVTSIAMDCFNEDTSMTQYSTAFRQKCIDRFVKEEPDLNRSAVVTKSLAIAALILGAVLMVAISFLVAGKK